MIVNVICAAIEALAQMSICIGIFVKAYGKGRNQSILIKIATIVLFIFAYTFKTLNNIKYVFSLNEILMQFPIITILLSLIIGGEVIRAAAWGFFTTVTMALLKLPTLVIIGLTYDESLSDMVLVRNSQTWSRLVNCVINIAFFIVYIKENKFIVKHFKNMTYQRVVCVFIGGIEFAIIYYIMYLGWYGFTIHTLILTLSLIFLLFMFVVGLITILEYHIMIRINSLLMSKENSMRINYSLLNQEIERNRKINHDNKYDLQYLYHCFEQKDYRRGLDYIKQRESKYNLLQKNLIWTGYGSIDFIINLAKARADEKKILFTIEVDIVEIPIEEYDFFSVLSNLLDNAIEASSQNNEGEGRITLQILSLNNVFRLKIENTYLIEPNKKGKRFISSKDDNTLHGWGIENVKEIVNKYKGEIDIEYGNGIFLVIIVLIK